MSPAICPHKGTVMPYPAGDRDVIEIGIIPQLPASPRDHQPACDLLAGSRR
jgi:hypothetical protein